MREIHTHGRMEYRDKIPAACLMGARQANRQKTKSRCGGSRLRRLSPTSRCLREHRPEFEHVLLSVCATNSGYLSELKATLQLTASEKWDSIASPIKLYAHPDDMTEHLK